MNLIGFYWPGNVTVLMLVLNLLPIYQWKGTIEPEALYSTHVLWYKAPSLPLRLLLHDGRCENIKGRLTAADSWASHGGPSLGGDSDWGSGPAASGAEGQMQLNVETFIKRIFLLPSGNEMTVHPHIFTHPLLLGSEISRSRVTVT